MARDHYVDALRYTVLRRIATAVRHDIAGRLHPLMLIADVVHHQIASDTPDLALLRQSTLLLRTQMKKELPALTRLATWIAPRDDVMVNVNDGVAECLALLSAEFGLSNVRFENRVGDFEAAVRATQFNTVFTATLLAAFDSAQSPGDLVVDAAIEGSHVVLTILRRGASVLSLHEAREYIAAESGPLSWDDVAHLAAAESVGFSEEASKVKLRFTSAP